MENITETVETVEETQEQTPMESTSEKMFSESELDAIVKKRIDKQNAKHGAEVDTFTARIAELEAQLKTAQAERDQFSAQMEMASWKSEASKETGVPAELLRGSNAEEIMEHAKAIAETLNTSKQAYPSFRDGGGAEAPKPTNANILGDFIKNNFTS